MIGLLVATGDHYLSVLPRPKHGNGWVLIDNGTCAAESADVHRILDTIRARWGKIAAVVMVRRRKRRDFPCGTKAL